MTVYYNEIDPFASEWLKALIARGVLPAGDVDTRSIEDVAPDDLRPYTACHFFAGIGVWAWAGRCAGMPDDYPWWSGSCPCQPFSEAGKGAGFADERHLWPAWEWLIGERHPGLVVGEQVASKAGLDWLDLVQADLESRQYACGAVNLPAAGVGAPHKRLRTFFVAYDYGQRLPRRPERDGGALEPGEQASQRHDAGRRGLLGAVAHHQRGRRLLGDEVGAGQGRYTDGGGDPRSLADGEAERRDRRAEPDDRRAAESPGRLQPQGNGRLVIAPGEQVGLSGLSQEPGGTGIGQLEHTDGGRYDAEVGALRAGWGGVEFPGWADCDWIPCRDEKWRPVEPGTFPLAHGAPKRVGRLRGYGNAIVAPLAQVFLEEVLNCL